MEATYAIMLVITGVVQAAIIGAVAWLYKREARRREENEKKIEKRAAIRAEESRLAMRLMSANTSLAVATGLALKENRVNGKMDIALAEAGKAQADYFAFINSVASSQMSSE